MSGPNSPLGSPGSGGGSPLPPIPTTEQTDPEEIKISVTQPSAPHNEISMNKLDPLPPINSSSDSLGDTPEKVGSFAKTTSPEIGKFNIIVHDLNSTGYEDIQI